MLRMTVAAVVTLLLGAGQGSAYEFWIDPESFLCEAGDTLSADIRIGEEFDGVALALAPERIARFEVRSSQGELQVDDTVGARPALRAEGLPEGLAVIVHETTPRILTWSQAGRFLSFVRDKGLGDILEASADWAEDRMGLREEHVRYAKSLVAIGHGRGDDRVVGLRTEFVALANPYADDLAGALPVQLWLDGAPRRMATVEVFARPAMGGPATRTVHETDTNGIVVLSVRPGLQYLMHSVALEAGDGSEGAPDWRTLWASLTFEVPAPQPPQ
jgi:hypothetical protein